MVIKVDSEGKKVLLQLCNIALKYSGLDNLDGVNSVLNSIELIADKQIDQNKDDKK